jgi:glycosyltransferase involved in cell wall biosynthesis
MIMSIKPTISVAIITYNEESNLLRTLKAVSDIASEIIIIDSYSKDKTIEIAERFGAKIFTEDWKGFVDQKNSAIDKCTKEWILMLDADEVVSEELKLSMVKEIASPVANGYYINRKTHYIGKLMDHAWQPDWNLRLVKRSANPEWKGDMVHEYLEITGRKAKLDGILIHYSYNNIKHHFEKTIRYAEISARSYFEKGRRAGVVNLLINPIYAFIRLYFLRLGFLDGIRGFIAAISSAFGTFLKYAFLWEIERSGKSEMN